MDANALESINASRLSGGKIIFDGDVDFLDLKKIIMLRFLGWHSVVILVVMVIPSNGTEDVRNSNITHAFNRANMMILLWLHCMVKLLF